MRLWARWALLLALTTWTDLAPAQGSDEVADAPNAAKAEQGAATAEEEQGAATAEAPAAGGGDAASSEGEETKDEAAKDEEERRAQAAAVYRKGVEAYKRGDYPEAVVYFLRADRIISRPEFSFNIARAYDKLGDDANSLRWYRDYLRRSPEANDQGEISALIEQRQLALMEQGLQQMTVLSEPPGATLLMDGQAVGVTPWTGELTPGTHRLELRLAGYRRVEQEAYLPADEAVDVSLALEVAPDEPSPSAAGAEPTSRASTSQPPSKPVSSSESEESGISPVWSWVALGAGGVALGASAGFEVARRKSEDRARDAGTQLGRAEAYDQMITRQTTARVLAGVGGALVVTGAVLWLVSGGDEEAGSSGLALGCDPSGCSLLTRGRF